MRVMQAIHSMKNIHKVVQQYGWKLETRWYAFGGGYFVYVTPYKRHSSDFTGLTHLPNALSLEAKWMYHFIQKEGAWLPIVYAETLDEGVVKLEKKLEGMITQEWLDRVHQAYDDVLLLFKESAETQEEDHSTE
ncbi:hypothetical protein I588_02028 [Enterococcus pallens ATCC BAA-351]|uniref:Uncharacterized protein n=2 Tax=Enterococcus pallens TaxID=160454 RepID=R2SQ81_9ENTE|nr:hypothetical protein UAU_00068 [Enterococcus pallens ATCC BAA-351]EOU21181.1 hypothetical protein I588_02028 [Enterococcus pallens ATCC BAA-351]